MGRDNADQGRIGKLLEGIEASEREILARSQQMAMLQASSNIHHWFWIATHEESTKCSDVLNAFSRCLCIRRPSFFFAVLAGYCLVRGLELAWDKQQLALEREEANKRSLLALTVAKGFHQSSISGPSYAYTVYIFNITNMHIMFL